MAWKFHEVGRLVYTDSGAIEIEKHLLRMKDGRSFLPEICVIQH